jgi:hypothetical protein
MRLVFIVILENNSMSNEYVYQPLSLIHICDVYNSIKMDRQSQVAQQWPFH